MLIKVARFLRNAESLNFNLSRDKSGLVRVLVQPVLGPEPDGLDAEALQLRALLAKPLIVPVADADLDTVLPAILDRAASSRDAVSTLYEAYVADMEMQAESARKAAEDKAKSKTTEKKAALQTKTPTPPPVAAQPDSVAPTEAHAPSYTAPSTTVQLFE